MQFIMVRRVKMAGIGAKGFRILSDFREFIAELRGCCHPCFICNLVKNRSFILSVKLGKARVKNAMQGLNKGHYRLNSESIPS